MLVSGAGFEGSSRQQASRFRFEDPLSRRLAEAPDGESYERRKQGVAAKMSHGMSLSWFRNIEAPPRSSYGERCCAHTWGESTPFVVAGAGHPRALV